ncbi:MAG: O-methyltransferase [Pseudobdellovibrio sp.]
MRKNKSKSYEYIENLIGEESEAQKLARLNSEKLGLGAISLSSVEASLLAFLADQIQAEKIVEIGTLTGLSALYLLEKAGSKSFLWTLEKDEKHAEMAQQVLQKYISEKRCEILLGDAREKLLELTAKAPFDIIFIDGNKAAYLDYFNWAEQNIRVGGLIVLDNVFLAGAVWGDTSQQRFNDKQIKTLQTVNEKAFKTPHFSSVMIPTEEGLLVCKKMF